MLDARCDRSGRCGAVRVAESASVRVGGPAVESGWGGVGCAWSLAHDTMQEPNYSKLVVLRCFLKSVVRFARALIAVNERACVRACACVCVCVFAPQSKERSPALAMALSFFPVAC